MVTSGYSSFLHVIQSRLSSNPACPTLRKNGKRPCAIPRYLLRRFTDCLLLCILLTATQVHAQDREVRKQRILSERVQERTANSQQINIIRAQVAASEADSMALVSLYNFSGGVSWFDHSGWLQKPVSQWYGIVLNEQGHVLSIDLSGNGLIGFIPPGIWTMGKMEIMDLSENQLDFLSTESVANLTSLKELILWGNRLSGPIPPELGQMPALEKLSLFQNRLSGQIPPELGAIKTLKQLYLDFNGLEGRVPAELGEIPELTELFLDANNLTGRLPVELTQLRSLVSLFAGFNHLDGPVPAELAAMPALENLSLEGNQHTGYIPAELVTAGNLTRLHFAHNQLTGPIPEGFGRLFLLTTLDLEGNQLTGSLPADIGDSRNMRYLNLSHNQLKGPVNALPRTLDELHLRQNQLIGAFSAVIGPITSLRKIDLRENAFSGTLEGVYSHQILVEIRLSNNQFTGAFSPPCRTMSYLEHLDIAHNKLHEIGQLTEWEFLDTVQVSGNQFDFTDLLPNAGLIHRGLFSYAPHDSLITRVTGNGIEVMFSVADSAAGNTCQWYRNGNALNGANSAFVRINIHDEPVAEYYCEITNDMLPSLTLTSTVKTTDATSTDIDHLPEKIEKITVGQNYPNPFQTETVIPIIMHNPSRLKIAIYDVTGRETFTLIQRIMSAGEHVIPVPAAGLTSGIYRYVVDVGGDQIVHSMVLIQ